MEEGLFVDDRRAYRIIIILTITALLLVGISAVLFWNMQTNLPVGQNDFTAEARSVKTVWIPETGEKYHTNPNCSNMRRPKKTSRQEAERRGYEPCKKCYPEWQAE